MTMMKKHIFLSDLDRTLIFSYKRLPDTELCVEEKDGKKLSYMTHEGGRLYGEVCEAAEFIPITTRSAEQFNRITFPGGHTPKYAVIANGADLLVNGIPDEEWRIETDRIFAEALPEIAAAKAYLKKEKSVYFEIRIVDNAFLFTKSSNSDEVISRMNDELCPETVDLFTNGDKLYAIPKGICKKAALERIRRRFPDSVIIAAGDSLFDTDMLSAADIAVVKSGELSGMELNGKQFTETADDPDFALKTVLEICDTHEKERLI